ncbi:MAG: cation:proton antiporter, partial [Halobacteriaceae archaeon]
YIAAYLYTGLHITSIILATGLASTALAVVIPTMQREGLDEPLIANAAMFSEMLGILLLLGFTRAQTLSVDTLLLEIFAMIGFVAVTVFLVPKAFEQLQILQEDSVVDLETKIIYYVVFVLALVSEQLGIHAATGAFLAGLFLSESTHEGLAIEKRLAPVTDLLVPIFFLHVGYIINTEAISVTMVGIAGAFAAIAFFTRIIAFRLWNTYTPLQFDVSKGTLLAPCMTITATAAQIGLENNMFGTDLFTTFIIAGLILTIIGPAGMQLWQKTKT